MTPVRWAIVAAVAILSIAAAWLFFATDDAHYIYDLHLWATRRPH